MIVSLIYWSWLIVKTQKSCYFKYNYLDILKINEIKLITIYKYINKQINK